MTAPVESETPTVDDDAESIQVEATKSAPATEAELAEESDIAVTDHTESFKVRKSHDCR